MADKVMDWKGTKLMSLASPGLLAAANVGGKQVGVPSTAEAFGLVYNKAVIKAAVYNFYRCLFSVPIT
jgi:raffinose/stachyose/melibiose transport system substrate-binding protein